MRTTRRPARNRVRLEIECLENRSVPSATPLGGDVLANTTLPLSQQAPDTAMSGDGSRYVVVWESGSTGAFDVFGQLYNGNGSAIGGEFRISTTTAPENRLPKVGMDASGNFVVVWVSVSGTNADVRARLFNTSGTPLGNDFAVSADPGINETIPAVAMDGTGNFVVVWQANGNIFAQRYSTGGPAVGGAWQINQNILLDPNPDTPRGCGEASIAMDNGNIAVAWTVQFNETWPDEPKLVVGRTLRFANAAMSNEFFINNPYDPYPNGGTYPLIQEHTSVAISNSGLLYVVAYAQHNLQIDDPRPDGFFARTFSIDAASPSPPVTAPTTAAFMVNAVNIDVLDPGAAPDVAMDAVGNFVVTWEYSGSGVFARTFTSTASPGNEFQVNQTTGTDQKRPAVALSDSGLMVIVWQSWTDYDTDGDGIPDSEWDVFSRRYSVTFP